MKKCLELKDRNGKELLINIDSIVAIAKSHVEIETFIYCAGCPAPFAAQITYSDLTGKLIKYIEVV